MKTRNQAKINIPMFLAGILFCLTLFSIHMTGGLYAKYTTSGSGNDSARVITFGDLTLTESGKYQQNDTAKEFKIIPGVNIQKQATVSFTGSEAATYVFVEVMPSDKWSVGTDNFAFTTLDSKLSWAVANGWNYLKDTSSPWVYYIALGPNVALNKNIIADISGDSTNGNIAVSDEITKSELAKLTDDSDNPILSIKFQAYVVQSGGFETPAAAWASVSGKSQKGDG